MNQLDNIDNFNPDIKNLRNIPVPIDSWAYAKVGRRNDGVFKDDYQSLKVEECGEGLVDIGDYNLSNENYYKKLLGATDVTDKEFGVDNVLLRKTHAKRLAQADEYFRERGLYIHIVSGWRHPNLQKRIKADYSTRFGKEKAERLFASIEGSVPAPHSTGASFDIELRFLVNDKRVEMNAFLNDEKIPSLYWGEELLKEGRFDPISAEAIRNRRILYHGLCTQGIVFKNKECLFTAHPGEYWHYGDGDTLSSYLNKKVSIKYGLICP